MMRYVIGAAASAILLSMPIARADGQPVPYGHRAFYPSPDRVIGFRGDGNGAYPAATPVTEWREGTPKQITLREAGERPQVVWELADRKSRNIVWRTRIRGFGNSHPIIVGDRAITTSDPFWLVCIDMHTGNIIWQRATSPFEMRGLSEEEIDQLDLFVDMMYAARAPISTMVGNYTRLPTFHEKLRRTWMKVFGMCIPVMRRMAAENQYGEKALPALEVMETALAGIDKLQEGQEGKPIAGIVGKIMWQGALKTDPPSWSTWIRETYKFFAYVHWDGWCGWTLGSPVSDGTHIYQWIGQGQVVCYDLAGNRKWGIHYPYDPEGTPMRGDGMQHMPSPVLIGDVLVVQVTDELVGIDKHTGNVRWHLRNSVHHFAMGSPKHITLKNGVDVVVPVSGKIVRVSDGKIVGELGVMSDTGAAGGGESMVGIENHVYLPAKRTGKVMGFELVAEGADKVTARKMWEVPGRHAGASPVVFEDHYYRFEKGGTVVNWRTGRKMPEPVNFTIRTGGIGPIMAGKYFFWYENGTAYGRKRRDKRMVSECQVLELTGPGTAKVHSSVNLLDGSDRPDMVRFKTHNPAFWEAKRWDPQGGVPGQFAHGGFCAQGNRLILRPLDSLICLGDPTVPYDWDPAARPKAVDNLLEAAVWPAGVPGILARLESPYRWEREAAQRLAAALAEPEQGALAAPVAELLGSESWFTAKAAGLLLKAMGARAAPAGPAIGKALVKGLENGDMLRGVLFAQVLAAAAPAQVGTIEAAVQRALTSGSAAARRVAARAVGHLGTHGAPFVASLASMIDGDDDALATEAARAVTRIGSPAQDAAPSLGRALARGDEHLTEACLTALSVLGDHAAAEVPAIAGILASQNPHRAKQAAVLLYELGDAAEPAVPQLLKAIRHPYGMVAVAASRALSSLGAEGPMCNALLKVLEGKDSDAIYNAARIAQNVGPGLTSTEARAALVDALGALVNEREKTTMSIAAIALSAFGTKAKRAFPQLKKAALRADISDIAKAAIRKVDPSVDVDNLKPAMGVELGIDADDIDLDFGL